MGCTHSKNSKSKSKSSSLRGDGAPTLAPPTTLDQTTNTVAHFDNTQNQSQSRAGDERIAAAPVAATNANLSRNMLLVNEKRRETADGGKRKGLRQLKTVKLEEDRDAEEEHGGRGGGGGKHEKEEKQGIHSAPPPQPAPLPKSINLPPEPSEDPPQHAEVDQVKIGKYAQSAYYPFPDKQMSPERKKASVPPIIVAPPKMAATEGATGPRVTKRKEVVNVRDNKTIQVGPTYRQLTPEDLEYIRRSVQQRNERRAYMMQHRNESDDTLYELEARMPEKDYTANNIRV